MRDTALYREAEAFYESVRRPGTGQISDAADVSVSPDGEQAVFAGAIADKLEGATPTRVCCASLESGEVRVLTFGPNTDRLPKYAPDGRTVAFLSDRRRAGDFQLFLLDPASGAARTTAAVDGWVEYLQWAPDGRRILLGVASHGADVSSATGAVTSKQAAGERPSWMPTVETGDDAFRWRSLWVYELASDSVRQVSLNGCNVWDASWCGNDTLAAVVSSAPGEGEWYRAGLHLMDACTGGSRELYRPGDQLSAPTASPSGVHIAVIEALCSDRGIVAGDLLLIEVAIGNVQRVDTRGVDITCIEWRSDRYLLFAGHRGFEMAVGLYDVVSRELKHVWSSSDITTGGYAKVAGLNDSGDCALVGEGFTRGPEIALIRRGEYVSVRSFAPDTLHHLEAISSTEPVRWKARDGLEIQGWLVRPRSSGSHPLVMIIHGGPVSHHRPTWLARASAIPAMLIERGYALLYPNPRGSSGRGQDFARQVLGEMGGPDGLDCLAGVDHLVERGIADPERLGVTGGSYGGFMTAWLITQDTRFAAAVAVAPMTNHVSHHLVSNIPHFVRLFLDDSYINPTGKYFARSPIVHAHKAKTPTLNICGALDRCTPAEEAVQFHNALLENGVESVLVTYPQEGHGVRTFPALIDYAARVVDWFERHLVRSGQPG